MILCVGLSPAYQRLMHFDALRAGEVNRADEVRSFTGGKALNVARVLATLHSEHLLLHTLGGDTGRAVDRAIVEAGIRHEPVWTDDAHPTRTCVTLRDARGTVTELVEETPPLDAATLDRVTARVIEQFDGAAALCLSGSQPEGVPDDWYAQLIDEAHRREVKTLVDCQKAPLRQAMRARPFLAKPNLQETLEAFGLPSGDDPTADGLAAAGALNDAGAEWALISAGARLTTLRHRDGDAWRLTPPRVDAVNPIGAGDTLAAGLLHAHAHEGLAVPEAAAFGMACAAASCLSADPAVLDPDRARALRDGVSCRQA